MHSAGYTRSELGSYMTREYSRIPNLSVMTRNIVYDRVHYPELEFVCNSGEIAKLSKGYRI